MTQINVLERVNITEALEAMIDKTSLLDVLVGLELVCHEKAEHIRQNGHTPSYRDTAKVWDRASNLIDTVARKIDPLNI